MAVEENWNLKEHKDIEEPERRIKKLKREIAGRLNEDNMLKSKTTRDHCL